MSLKKIVFIILGVILAAILFFFIVFMITMTSMKSPDTTQRVASIQVTEHSNSENDTR